MAAIVLSHVAGTFEPRHIELSDITKQIQRFLQISAWNHCNEYYCYSEYQI